MVGEGAGSFSVTLCDSNVQRVSRLRTCPKINVGGMNKLRSFFGQLFTHTYIHTQKEKEKEKRSYWCVHVCATYFLYFAIFPEILLVPMHN